MPNRLLTFLHWLGLTNLSDEEVNLKKGWSTGLPQVEGDYLWLQCFSCGCPIKSGIVYVAGWKEDEESRRFHKNRGDKLVEYKNRLGGDMNVCFSPHSNHPLPDFDENDMPLVDYWMKLDMPIHRD